MTSLIRFVFRHREMLIGVCILGVLVGCGVPGVIYSDLSNLRQTDEIPTPLLTRTIQAHQTITYTNIPNLVTVSVTPTRHLILSPTATKLPCDLAAAGVPLDVTYPDDTRVNPSERIVKTWRLVNVGSCDWTSAYSIEWFSGDLPSTNLSQPLEELVSPGKSVDVSVEIDAPREPGIYTSYWILKNPKGNLFGIGPEGRSPFWIRIQVVAEDNLPTLATVTPVPDAVYQASGVVNLLVDEQLDLDSGLVSTEPGADIIFQDGGASGYVIAPLNNTRLGKIGVEIPSPVMCQGLTMTEDPIQIGETGVGNYVCYLTSMGSWGFFNLSTSNPIQVVSLVFYTWMQP